MEKIGLETVFLGYNLIKRSLFKKIIYLLRG